MKIPNKMKYIEIKKFGSAEVLKLSEIDVPDINKNEVLNKIGNSKYNTKKQLELINNLNDETELILDMNFLLQNLQMKLIVHMKIQFFRILKT